VKSTVHGTTLIYRQIPAAGLNAAVISYSLCTITCACTSQPTRTSFCISMCFQCEAPGRIHNLFLHAPLISRLLSVWVYRLLLFPFQAFFYVSD